PLTSALLPPPTLLGLRRVHGEAALDAFERGRPDEGLEGRIAPEARLRVVRQQLERHDFGRRGQRRGDAGDDRQAYRQGHVPSHRGCPHVVSSHCSVAACLGGGRGGPLRAASYERGGGGCCGGGTRNGVGQVPHA